MLLCSVVVLFTRLVVVLFREFIGFFWFDDDPNKGGVGTCGPMEVLIRFWVEGTCGANWGEFVFTWLWLRELLNEHTPFGVMVVIPSANASQYALWLMKLSRLQNKWKLLGLIRWVQCRNLIIFKLLYFYKDDIIIILFFQSRHIAESACRFCESFDLLKGKKLNT